MEELRSCPRCERTMESGTSICSYCGCDIDAIPEGEYVESMYDSGTLQRGSKPLIDLAPTRTKTGRIKVLVWTLISFGILLLIGAVVNTLA